MKLIISSTAGRHVRPTCGLSRADIVLCIKEGTVMTAFCMGMYFLACAVPI